MYIIDLSNQKDDLGRYCGQVVSDGAVHVLHWYAENKSLFLDKRKIGDANRFSEIHGLVVSHLSQKGSAP